MPRIVLTMIQIALFVVIVLTAGAIYQKQIGVAGLKKMTQTTNMTPAPTRNAEKPPKPYAAYQSIARRDLFQTPKETPPAATEIDLAALKPTELKLRLWGTITGEDGLTRAVIEDQIKKEQVFVRTGEEIASATIKMILREKVVLSVNGEDQILEIQQPTGLSRPGVVTSSAPVKANVMPVAAPPPASAQPSLPRSIRMKLGRLGPISEDSEDWNKDTIASPFIDESGQDQAGLMINRITPSSPLRRLGIRNGDVVLRINDQPVSELSDIFEALLEVSEGETLSMNLKRRGTERQFDFQFE
jgi:general secretion pathway protein C